MCSIHFLNVVVNFKFRMKTLKFKIHDKYITVNVMLYEILMSSNVILSYVYYILLHSK